MVGAMLIKTILGGGSNWFYKHTTKYYKRGMYPCASLHQLCYTICRRQSSNIVKAVVSLGAPKKPPSLLRCNASCSIRNPPFLFLFSTLKLSFFSFFSSERSVFFFLFSSLRGLSFSSYLVLWDPPFFSCLVAVPSVAVNKAEVRRDN